MNEDELRQENARLVQTLKDAVYNQRYYMKTRGRYLKSQDRYASRLSELSHLYQEIKDRFEKVQMHRFRKGEPGFILKVTDAELSKLKTILGQNHLRCLRCPPGKAVPYLTEPEVKRLRRLLCKKRKES